MHEARDMIIGFGGLLLACAGLMVWHWRLGRSERAALAQERKAAASRSAVAHGPQPH